MGLNSPTDLIGPPERDSNPILSIYLIPVIIVKQILGQILLLSTTTDYDGELRVISITYCHSNKWSDGNGLQKPYFYGCSGLEIHCSIQLSYRRLKGKVGESLGSVKPFFRIG